MRKILGAIFVVLTLMGAYAAKAQLSLPFPGPGVKATAAGCTGTINLSTGCVQPMLR